MRRHSLAAALLLGLMTIAGCDLFDHDDNSPDPMTLAHHSHRMVLYVRSVNLAADTVGLVSVRSPVSGILARRDEDSHLTRSSAPLGGFAGGIQCVYDDTLWHACTTAIDHFTGYQSRYGGDTSRFGALDRYGNWSCWLSMHQANAVLRRGDTVVVYTQVLHNFPDTVRANGVLEVEMTVDMDGLMERESTATSYTMKADHVGLRQR